MSPLSKVLYPCLILLLAWLAVVPHWPAIREEAESFYTAWQQVRSSGKAESTATLEKSPTEKESRRQRAIAPPKPVAELPISSQSETSAEALDPFIREARERAQEDPQAAMQWLQEQSTGADRLRGMLEVVALWAAKDSESALLWLESNAQGIARLETLNSGVALWAERDPQAAASWIDGMANDGSKIAAAKSLASTWAKSNPGEAARWVAGLPNGRIREEAALALVAPWVTTDPSSALRWARNTAQNSNDPVFVQAIQAYTRMNPEEAEAFIRKMPVDPFRAPDANANHISQFVRARSEQDPVETAKWLQSLPQNDPLKRPQNASHLMEIWAKTDSIAASAWLSEQPPGAERDAAIVGFAETIRNFEPEAAAAWSNTISDPERRTEQLTQTLRTWSEQNSDAALDWVLNSDLAPAKQEQLASEIGFD